MSVDDGIKGRALVGGGRLGAAGYELGVDMDDGNTIRCNFCGDDYAGEAVRCPSCNFPTPGKASVGAVSNMRIGLNQVIAVGAVAVLAITLAILFDGVLLVDDEESVTGNPGLGTSGEASTRAEAWSTSVNGSVTGKVSLPKATIVSTNVNLTRINADGSNGWITSPASEAVAVALSPGGDYVVTEGSAGQAVGAYDTGDGEVRWSLEAVSFVGVVADGVLVRSGDGPFGLLDEDGGLTWRVETNDEVAFPEVGEPAEVVFVRTGLDVVGLDIESGQERWSTRARLKARSRSLAMAATNDMVVLSGPRRTVAYDADSGEQLWATDGNGGLPQIRQFAPDLVAVTFDGDATTTLFDPQGKKTTLPGESRSTSEIVTFDVDGASYAADTRNATVYDDTGTRVGTYPEGIFSPSPDGYFVSAADIAMHFELGATSADYTVPAPSGAEVAALKNRVVVISGSELRGY